MVKGWEFRVGDNQITHHMCSSVISPDVDVADGTVVEEEGADVAGSRLLSCVAEGGEADMLPEGFGVLLETGSSLSFNMHFHKEPAEGSAAWSNPEIGFFVADEPVQHKVINDSLSNRGFEIPPNHPNYRIGSSRVLEKDTLVLTYWPHAHLRAIAARYVAHYPDGTEEMLLDVPHYDQSWAGDVQVQGAEAVAEGHPHRCRLLVRQLAGTGLAARIRPESVHRPRPAHR